MDFVPPTSEVSDVNVDRLRCTWNYICLCILLPTLNGGLNGFMWPGYGLHFVDMGWPVVLGGLAVTFGYLLRSITQQMQLRGGYWMVVPLATVHLVVAVLAWAYGRSLWAVFAQVVVFLGIDPTCALEGIAFDTFGDSEVQAQKATSTILSVYTIAVALSCTLGGIMYDVFGWKGVCTYHMICQGLQLFLLCIQPAIRQSFMEVFFAGKDHPDPAPDDAAKNCETVITFTSAVPPEPRIPTQPMEVDLPGVPHPELRLEEVSEASQGIDAYVQDVGGIEGVQGGLGSRPLSDATPDPESVCTHSSGRLPRGRRTRATFARPRAGSDETAGSKHGDEVICLRRRSGQSQISTPGRRSMVSVMSAVSNASNVTTSRHHFATSNALPAWIVGATGGKAVARVDGAEAVDEDGQVVQVASANVKAKMPADMRFPCLLIVLNSLCSNAVYTIEFATFGIFFRQVHNWNEATWASLAQSAGDVTAAIAMQVIPLFCTNESDECNEHGPDDPQDFGRFGCVRRFLRPATSQPYNLSWILALWVLFNLGLISPVLSLAIVSQVLMGTVYVYSSKCVTDMNLFYSLGDAKLFMTLQVYCRNAEALGGSVAGLWAVWLFTLDPMAPYSFSVAMAGVLFVVYTVGFCRRLGFGDDIELAEEKRSRRLGKKRVSSWKQPGKR